MGWTNYHTHCFLCDGGGKPGEYIIEAIRQDFDVIGFSSHAPLPFDTTWTMKKENMHTYLNMIDSLKKQYSDSIKIKTGLEIDYIPDVTGPGAPFFNTLGLDYSIGSVHFIGRNNGGMWWTADSSAAELRMGIEDSFSGSVKDAVEYYYFLIKEMVSRGGFDIIGHLDLIKKNNAGNIFFDEAENWYKDCVIDTLKAISTSGLILEINTGGMSRKYIDCTYPSPWILEECCKMKIPMTLNSDAHSPQTIAACFSESAKILKYTGINELYVLCGSKWEPRQFDINGFI